MSEIETCLKFQELQQRVTFFGWTMRAVGCDSSSFAIFNHRIFPQGLIFSSLKEIEEYIKSEENKWK